MYHVTLGELTDISCGINAEIHKTKIIPLLAGNLPGVTDTGILGI